MDGLDVKAMGDWLADNGATLAVTLFLVIGLGLLLTSNMAKRVGRLIEQTMFSNWRLALLAATGVILSLASGWTTWDGMRNFTGEPLLSLMITFGIQGVMLIVAWLIGESFASGMNQRGAQGSIGLWGMLVAILGAFVLVGGLVALAVLDMTFVRTEHLVFAAIFIGIVAIIAAMQSDIVQPYLQSSRVILKNLVLWVMFLACMTTSVFFSFDSLFSTIFPAEERVRAAELRAQNQVAGIVADIGQTISSRRVAEAEELFRTEGWRTYDEQLANLSRASQGAQKQIEAYFIEQMEARRRAIAEQQERIATAQGSQAGLQSRKIQLTEELSRLTADRPAAVNEKQQQQQVVSEIERRLDEKRALTLAEERGVEGSGKVGRGKFWREAKAAEQKVKYELEVAKRRLRSPADRLEAIDKRIAIIKGELSQIEGALAQLAGEASTAQQRISAAERATTAQSEQLKVDPARVLPAFERAKTAFRQEPTQIRLSDLHQQCTQLVSAMASAPATKERVRSIDCDPKAASEAAATVFALNSGAQAFSTNCAGGEKLEANKSADALFGFARKCLADSGLPSRATDQLRTKINHAELNRDDKAHRFVVTWNAFQDGNRLAYLALGIAIAIDALVFMSGLFGANAVRSPLSDVPSMKARSAVQLESIVENALLPNKFDNAHAVLEAMQPITPVDGFTQEVVIPFEETPTRARVLKVLNAAATIGAVHRDEHRPERYLVRPELFEFLSSVAKRAFEEDKENVKNAELRQVVTVALQPQVSDNADLVLSHLHPINERHGFSSEVRLGEVADTDIAIVRKTLNAGSTLKFVQQDEQELDRFYIHKQLYKTLALISANYPKFAGGNASLPPPNPGAHHGGALGTHQSQIAPPPNAIEDHTMRAPPRAVTPEQDPAESAQSTANESGHAEFRDIVLDHFASELGMQTEQLDDIVNISSEIDIKTLKQVLEAVLNHDPNMRDPIVRAYQARDESISNALETFEHPGLGDNRNLHMLNEFAARLRTLRPMLLLLPGSAYNNLLQRMWKDLASGAERGNLDAVQERKLDLVQSHMQELAAASISERAGWEDVQHSLARFSNSLRQLAGSA